MDMLDSIKMELDGNDLLLADFPEAVYPIQALDGIANRCNGQLYKGERTHIGWTAREVVLPTLKPDGWLQNDELRPFVRDDGTSKASGAIIKVAGIIGRIRGMKYKRADGRTVRPTLVVLDSQDSRVERIGFAWERGKICMPNDQAQLRRDTDELWSRKRIMPRRRLQRLVRRLSTYDIRTAITVTKPTPVKPKPTSMTLHPAILPIFACRPERVVGIPVARANLRFAFVIPVTLFHQRLPI